MEEHFVVQTVKKPTDSDKKVELQCFIGEYFVTSRVLCSQ